MCMGLLHISKYIGQEKSHQYVLPEIVELIDEAIQNTDNDSALNSIKNRVNDMMVEFPLFSNEW